MTIRNLDTMFEPRSVALVGASPRPGSVGAVLARNLISAGFEGPIMPVNPKHRSVSGVLAYPDVASLPLTPDLAVISTPPETVPGLIGALGARGTRAAVVITAGFGELGRERGQQLEQELLNAARPHTLRVVGPNCLGIMVPKVRLDASFSPVRPRPGRLAFVAQSGAMATSVVDWADARAIGFSHVVSLGDMADVDFGDMLDYLANDEATRAILLYIESVTSARKFMSAARAAARTKPVIAVKAGRHAAAARAAASHTGALAGSDAVYDTALRRAGMLRVGGLSDLFDAAETLALSEIPRGDRLAILTNGGGPGVMATDDLIEEGGQLAELSDGAVEALDRVLPPTWSRGNPVDIIGDAPGRRYREALEILFEEPEVDAVLAINCPVAVASSTEAAQAVIDAVGGRPTRPLLLTAWLGDRGAEDARRRFSEHRIPTYDTPRQAVRAFMQVVTYTRNQELLMETPASIPEEFAPDTETARAVLASALEAGRAGLTEPEAKRVLAAYGIPVAEARTAATPDEAAEIAAEMDAPVALKILSPDISHKSDVGGVALDLKGRAEVKDAARQMMTDVRAAAPSARVEGFVLEPMVRRAGAFELIVGVKDDPTFGPVILFGHGGTGVEVVDDTALALPPLNMHLAREVMARTRVFRLLEGYRGRPAAHIEAVALTLIKVAQLAMDLAEVAALDINPLLADASGVVALDARVEIVQADAPPERRLAIRPYPKELEEDIPLPDGQDLFLRPVVPEDEPSFQRAFARLSSEEIRLRFFVPMKTLSHVTAARFTQIDYDREMALVLTERGRPGTTEIHGVVRLTADPDNERGEYAIIVRGPMTGRGLGTLLMRRIIDHGRRRGIREITGDVLRENEAMLKICDELGFEQEAVPDDLAIVRVRLELHRAA